MKKMLVTLAMLLTLGLSFQGVAAQELAPSDAGMELEDYEGLQSAYSRSYGVDMDAMMSTPSTEGINLADMMKGVQIMGITFDSDDNAQKFIDQGKDELESSLEEMSSGEMKVTVNELDKGDQGLVVEMDMTADVGVFMKMYLVRDGNVVFTVIAMNSDVDSATATGDSVVDYLLDNESQSDDVTFNADGTSTGGVFDRMPPVGHESVSGLVIDSDSDLLNPDTGTPAI